MKSLSQYIMESKEAVMDTFELDGTQEKDWQDLFADIEDGEPEDYAELSKILTKIYSSNFKGRTQVEIKADMKYNKKEGFNVFPIVDASISSKRFMHYKENITYYIDNIAYSKEAIRLTYHDSSKLYIIFK